MTSDPFSYDWDVVVIGYGYAGAAAACAAHDAGARTLIVEKSSTPGGISVCSAGGVRYAEDFAGAFSYLVATNAGTTDEDVLRILAQGMTELPERLERLAGACGATVVGRSAPANYPFPGHDAFGFLSVSEVPHFEPGSAYPHVRGGADGARLFRVMEANVERREIPVLFSSRAKRIHRPGSAEEDSLEISLEDGGLRESSGSRGRLRVRGGLVLACGGFEANPEMQRQYWQEKPVLNAAYAGNTGDGIRIAQAEGAALWHMWHYHGSYGFRHPAPNYPYGIRTKRIPDWTPLIEDGGPPADVRMPWIVVNRSGRRFMNEYEPYLQDTGHRPLARFRPELQRFDAIPAYLIADEQGRKQYPFGRETYNDSRVGFRWSGDNRAEIDLGILRQASDFDELAAGLSTDPVTLNETIAIWNRSCDEGRDAAFGRPASSMMPIRTPPYVFAELWPIVSNTQGGLVHDARQRVLNSFGEPIDGVYVAGELGSVFGHLYLSGGNLAECFVGGLIAGEEAARRAGHF